jgi:hypothetical protein
MPYPEKINPGSGETTTAIVPAESITPNLSKFVIGNYSSLN